MNLKPHQKLTLTRLNDIQNLKVIGIKEQKDGSQDYLLQTLLKDFGQSKLGGRLMIVNSKHIDGNQIKVH